MTASWLAGDPGADGRTDTAFGAIRALLADVAGWRTVSECLQDAAIHRAMVEAGMGDPFGYLEALQTRPELLDDLVDETAVGETYFLRDRQHFAFVRSEVLPGLGHIRETGVLRAWSAGCASGEEAYSLALVLDQAGWGDGVSILATDISRRALASACRGRYRAHALRAVEPVVLDRYFTRDGEWHVIDERIRRRVRFAHHNLAAAYWETPPAGFGFDLIFCRNVLIYLSEQTVGRVGRRLFDSLADGGWLIAGPSDPPLDEHAPYEPAVTPTGVLYRRGEALSPASPARAVSRLTRQRRIPTAPVTREDHRAGVPALPAVPVPELAVDAGSDPRAALEAGDYDAVVRLTTDAPDDPGTAALRVRALANRNGSNLAAETARRAVRRHPLSAELHLLHAVLLSDLGEHDEAVAAMRRARYLDPAVVPSGLMPGSALHQLRATPLVRCTGADDTVASPARAARRRTRP